MVTEPNSAHGLGDYKTQVCLHESSVALNLILIFCALKLNISNDSNIIQNKKLNQQISALTHYQFSA